MKKAGIVYKANGEISKLVPKNGTDYSLKELQDVVGGCIETVPLRANPKLVMVVNDEGRLRNMQPNRAASMYYGGLICGDALVCNREMIK